MASPRSLGQPATLAVVGDVVVVGDRSGAVAFVRWPSGEVVALEQAHGDAGPLEGCGAHVVTAGGWDPAVASWDPADGRRRWSVRPFDGRVTALAGDAEGVLVAGADRHPSAALGKDGVALQRAAVLELSAADGSTIRTVADDLGAVTALALGQGWVAYVDDGALVVVVGREAGVAGGIEGAVTALVAGADGLVVATSQGCWRHDPSTGGSVRLAPAGGDGLEVLGLAVVDSGVVASTSEGLRLQPGDVPIGPRGRQPAAVTSGGGLAWVLWPDGRIQQLDGAGAVAAEVVVPHDL